MIPFGYTDPWPATQTGMLDDHVGNLPSYDYEAPAYPPVIIPTSIEEPVSTYRGMNVGGLPGEMLFAKFEETNVEEDPEAYGDFARSQLTDQRPDDIKFEYERPRGGTERQSGRLRLQYWGSRGDAEPANHPELFLGFGGGDFRDPRAHNVDPDFKELTRQSMARQRFHRFSKDDNPQITGGARSEGRAMEDNKRLFLWSRDLFKIFSRQLDGPRNGLMRQYEYASNVGKVRAESGYGDAVRDYALNPTRSPGIIMKQLLRDTTAYRSTTYDQDFDYARYAQVCKSGQLARDTRVATAQEEGLTLGDSENNMRMKAAALLVSQLIMTKRNSLAGNQDIQFAAQMEANSGRTASIAQDISKIWSGAETTTGFGASEEPAARQQPGLSDVSNVRKDVDATNHLTPAHILLNADLVYKSLKPGTPRVDRGKIIKDGRAATAEDVARARKTRKRETKRADGVADQDTTEQMTVHNYKTALKNQRGHLRAGTPGHDHAESDLTKILRVTKKRAGVGVNKNTEIHTYGANLSKDRHVGGIGTKYTMRVADREQAERMDDW